MEAQKTTPVIRKDLTSNFPWGKVLKVHEFGRYAILEYVDRLTFKERLKDRGANIPEKDQSALIRDIMLHKDHVSEAHDLIAAYNDSIRFHVFVDGDDKHVTSRTFEGAVLLAISHHSVGEPNEARYMAQAAAKILDVLRD